MLELLLAKATVLADGTYTLHRCTYTSENKMTVVYKLNMCAGDGPVVSTMVFSDISIAYEWKRWAISRDHNTSHIVTETVVTFLPPGVEERIKRALLEPV